MTESRKPSRCCQMSRFDPIRPGAKAPPLQQGLDRRVDQCYFRLVATAAESGRNPQYSGRTPWPLEAFGHGDKVEHLRTQGGRYATHTLPYSLGIACTGTHLPAAGGPPADCLPALRQPGHLDTALLPAARRILVRVHGRGWQLPTCSQAVPDLLFHVRSHGALCYNVDCLRKFWP
jgi:hypothetical protein